MKIRIKHVGVTQCVRMIAGIYFVISLPIVACVLLFAIIGGEGSGGIGVLISFPIVYALVSYLGGLLSAWISNIVADRVGGIEYTTGEISS